jgi:hypothetical protein
LKAGHFAFKNDLSATDKLVEPRRNDGGCSGQEPKGKKGREDKETEWFFHLQERGGDFNEAIAKVLMRNQSEGSRS